MNIMTAKLSKLPDAQGGRRLLEFYGNFIKITKIIACAFLRSLNTNIMTAIVSELNVDFI